MAEPIEMPLGGQTRSCGLKEPMLNWWSRGGHVRGYAGPVQNRDYAKVCVCVYDSDVVLCQITVGTCFVVCRAHSTE